MASSGGSANPAYLQMGGQPMGGLPIAGSGNTVDPFKYGKFQNFLPDIPSQAEFDAGARAPSAQGLTQEMFQYKGPDGSVDSGSAPGSGGITGNDVNALRDQLSQMLGLKAQNAMWANPNAFPNAAVAAQQTTGWPSGGFMTGGNYSA